jgi:hypothetical protein
MVHMFVVSGFCKDISDAPYEPAQIYKKSECAGTGEKRAYVEDRVADKVIHKMLREDVLVGYTIP